ncbi:MAG: PEP-utilizing enzyme [Acidimicrobiales bacterium]|nr:hypothetical protein [Acidimicrobiales bacterium]
MTTAAHTGSLEGNWTAPDGGVWELDASHQEGVATAALQELMPAAFADGFRRAFAELGMPLSHLALEFVNGRTYTSAFVHGAPRKAGGPPPRVVLKLLTRLPPSARKRLAVAQRALTIDQPMNSVERWTAMRRDWIDKMVALADVQTAELQDSELADHIAAITDATRDGMRTHFELVGAGAAFGEFILAARGWGLDPDAVRRSVMHGVEVHREAWKRLDDLVRALGTTNLHTIDEISSLEGESAKALAEYLRYHGTWATGDDVDALTLAEQPTLLLKAIKAHRPLPDDHAQTLEWLRSQAPADERSEFDRLSRRAQRAHAMLEDNSGLLAAWPMGLLGRAMREAARRLTAQGAVPSPGSIWTLTGTETAALLNGSGDPTFDEVVQRESRRESELRMEAPRSLNGQPSPPPEPSVFPGAVAHWVAALGAFIDAKFDSAEPTGVGGQPVQGRAVVAKTAIEAFDKIEPGDILVTTSTTPAFNAILVICGGLVTSEGGPACHAAVVARELGLPAVIGLRDAMDRIQGGQMIEIDPQSASVRIDGGQ